MYLYEFEKMMELPVQWAKQQGYSEAFAKAVIARTLRIAYSEPELTKIYYDSIPKAIMDTVIVTSQREDCNGVH